jgi:hypothetical protein
MAWRMATFYGAVGLGGFCVFGRPPSFPFVRQLRAFAGVETLPMSAPTLISFPQCGQFMPSDF